MVGPTELTTQPMSGTVPYTVASTFHNGKRLFVVSSQDRAGFKPVASAFAKHLDTCGPAADLPEYLANFAHILALETSKLPYKAGFLAQNVAEIREKLSTDLGKEAVRTPSTSPRIGFVFTGLGSEHPCMGVALLRRPVFRASLDQSAAILKTLRCDWDLIEELSAETSRLSDPSVSPPVCSALQIALVQELKFWGVNPEKVVGNGNGEIAAAFASGAISHKDAMTLAYFRGTACAKLKYLGGGMMAVGASLEEAEKMLLEAKPIAGAVTVSSVNSPSSVTVSGDIAAIDELKTFLDQRHRHVFARRLKVDVAYNSSHAFSSVDEYMSSVAGLVPAQSFAGTLQMMSSVTGGEVTAENLNIDHWTRSLVSPVLFSDAVKELVSPANSDGSNTVDLLIEIGPHSALRGPIMTTLSHHGIEDVIYSSMLCRRTSAVDSSLELARTLFLHGVQFDMQKANGDCNSCF